MNAEELLDGLDEAAKSHPLVTDPDGVVRFRANGVIRALVDAARAGRRYDLNDVRIDLWKGKLSEGDVRELYRLIGYSVSGYHEVWDAWDAEKAG